MRDFMNRKGKDYFYTYNINYSYFLLYCTQITQMKQIFTEI